MRVLTSVSIKSLETPTSGEPTGQCSSASSSSRKHNWFSEAFPPPPDQPCPLSLNLWDKHRLLSGSATPRFQVRTRGGLDSLCRLWVIQVMVIQGFSSCLDRTWLLEGSWRHFVSSPKGSFSPEEVGAWSWKYSPLLTIWVDSCESSASFFVLVTPVSHVNRQQGLDRQRGH